MTARNITYPHTNAAHRHHLVTKFTSFLFKVYILVGRRVSFITAIFITIYRQFPCTSRIIKAGMAARTKHWFSSQTLFAYTTETTAAKYSLALAFIPTTSWLSYWLVLAARSHHQS